MNRKLVPWAVAICFGFATAWLADLYVTSRAENALLRDQLSLAELELQHIQNQLEAERIVNRRELADALGKTQQAAVKPAEPGGK
jgi:hypothetical protein